jgi:acyl carrier protein
VKYDIVEVKFRQILMQQLDVPPDALVPEARFDEDLGVDSLSRIELGLAVAEAFDFDEVPDEITLACPTYGHALVALRAAWLASGR